MNIYVWRVEVIFVGKSKFVLVWSEIFVEGVFDCVSWVFFNSDDNIYYGKNDNLG